MPSPTAVVDLLFGFSMATAAWSGGGGDASSSVDIADAVLSHALWRSAGFAAGGSSFGGLLVSPRPLEEKELSAPLPPVDVAIESAVPRRPRAPPVLLCNKHRIDACCWGCLLECRRRCVRGGHGNDAGRFRPEPPLAEPPPLILTAVCMRGLQLR
ncbi:unnamed protein product [Ectocarpus sp. 12 AP-2014]